MFTLCPQALSAAWQVCFLSLSLLNALFQKVCRIFSCSGLAEVEVDAEMQTEAETAAEAVAPVLF